MTAVTVSKFQNMYIPRKTKYHCNSTILLPFHIIFAVYILTIQKSESLLLKIFIVCKYKSHAFLSKDFNKSISGCFFVNLLITHHLHVCFDSPLLLFPWGLKLSTCLVVLSTSVLKVWPTHRHFVLLACTAIWCWLALFHRSKFSTLSYHLIMRIWRRHLLVKVWILFELLLTTLHVSEP